MASVFVGVIAFVNPIIVQSALASPSPVLDLEDLERRLASTPAVGAFSKLALKRDAGKLFSAFEAYHSGKSGVTIDELQERYALLIQKIVFMLQQKDPDLARDVAAAREPMWANLADPERFRSL